MPSNKGNQETQPGNNEVENEQEYEEMQPLISLAPPSPANTSYLEAGEERSLLYTPRWQDTSLSDTSANRV